MIHVSIDPLAVLFLFHGAIAFLAIDLCTTVGRGIVERMLMVVLSTEAQANHVEHSNNLHFQVNLSEKILIAERRKLRPIHWTCEVRKEYGGNWNVQIPYDYSPKILQPRNQTRIHVEWPSTRFDESFVFYIHICLFQDSHVLIQGKHSGIDHVPLHFHMDKPLCSNSNK